MSNSNLKSQEDLIRQQRIDILALKRLKVFTEEGEQIYLCSLWESEPVILVFIRHFNCIACQARVDQIQKFYKDIKKTKTHIVFIGSGEPSFIKSFKEKMNLPDAEIYTDSTLQTHEACGMNRSVSNLITLRSLMEMRNLRQQGYRQGKLEKGSGAHTQMGGVVAIRPPGIVTYHFTSKYLGDFDNPESWPV